MDLIPNILPFFVVCQFLSINSIAKVVMHLNFKFLRFLSFF